MYKTDRAVKTDRSSARFSDESFDGNENLNGGFCYATQRQQASFVILHLLVNARKCCYTRTAGQQTCTDSGGFTLTGRRVSCMDSCVIYTSK